MSQIPSHSEKSKMMLRPQPPQRYHYPDAEVVEEMEVDSLITPKANSTTVTSPITQPELPTPQVACGRTVKALPSGLNFSKAVTAGMLLTMSQTKEPLLTKLPGGKGKKCEQEHEAEEPDAGPSKCIEIDTTPPTYSQGD